MVFPCPITTVSQHCTIVTTFAPNDLLFLEFLSFVNLSSLFCHRFVRHISFRVTLLVLIVAWLSTPHTCEHNRGLCNPRQSFLHPFFATPFANGSLMIVSLPVCFSRKDICLKVQASFPLLVRVCVTKCSEHFEHFSSLKLVNGHFVTSEASLNNANDGRLLPLCLKCFSRTSSSQVASPLRTWRHEHFSMLFLCP